MGWTVLVFGAAVGLLRRALHVDAARPEAPARLLVDRERRHRRDGLRRRLPRAGPGEIPRSRRSASRGGLLHILNHALFKCLAVLRRGRGLSRRPTRSTSSGSAGSRSGCRARRCCSWSAALAMSRAAAAQRLRQRVHHLLGLAVGRRAVGVEGNVVARRAAAAARVRRRRQRAVDDARVRRRVPRSAARRRRPRRRRMRRRSMLVPMVAARAWASSCSALRPTLGARSRASPRSSCFPIRRPAPTSACRPLGARDLGQPGLGRAAPGVAARRLAARPSRARSVTWGCGYTARDRRACSTPAARSRATSRALRGLPAGAAPRAAADRAVPAARGSHRRPTTSTPSSGACSRCSVRARTSSRQTSERIPEQPRFAFAAGLVALVVDRARRRSEGERCCDRVVANLAALS